MKNKVVISLLFGLVVSLVFMSCEKDIAIPRYSSFGDDYLKIKEGTTWLYQIDSVKVDLIDPIQHHMYYQKEVVSKVEITQRNATYTIDVYRSHDLALDYKKTEVYTLQLYNDRVVHMGNDYNIIALTNPLEAGTKWYNLNSTCLNAQSVIDEHLDQYTHNAQTYYDIMDVTHYDYHHNDISQSHRSYYGKEVGLIYEMRYDRLRNSKTTITKSLLSYAY